MRVIGLILLVAACDTGDPTGNQSEAGMEQLGILCSTFYAAHGTFVPNASDPPPSGFMGCWPIGQWTFTLTGNTDPNTGGGADSCAGAHEPAPLAKYQFTGSTMPDTNGDKAQHFTYNPQASDPNVHITAKVTAGGTGVCQASLTLYDAMGTSVWTLKPELNADNSITGDAEYDLYGSNQWGGGI